MSAAEHFVVVDDEEDLLHTLVSALRRSRPGAEVLEFADPVAAAAHLERAPRADALITDIRMPKLDGIELLIRARRRRPRMPAVIMTAFPSPAVVSQVASFGTVEYLDKPFSVTAFLAAIDRVMLPAPSGGFAGALAIEGLPDLIQLCALSSSTSALVVRHGPRQGTIWFERGLVVHAQVGASVGELAFYEILTWKDGEFSVERGAATRQHTMQQKATELLIEASRRQDEFTRGEGQATSLEDLDQFDVESAIQEFDDPAGAEESSQPDLVASGNRTSAAAAAATKENDTMANIQTNLERLRNLDGYLGAALVDSDSGMTLGVDSAGGGGGFNFEVAAAGNTEVVRSKRKAMRNLALKDDIEDILISLGKQYHVIRPLKARGSVFYYVVLDRSRANLALARMMIADAEKALEV